MRLFTLLVIISFASSTVYSQKAFLVFKKKNKTINSFWQRSVIAFQLRDKEWHKGEITKITNDSFYIRPVVVKYYLMGTDTLHFKVEGNAVSDIYAMPKNGFLIDYKNGHFEISRTGGHVHFYWVKSGWLFRTVGAGYAALNIINGAFRNDLSFAAYKWPLIGSAAVFGIGVLLKKVYKPYLRIGKKYHMKTIAFPN